MNDIFYNNIEKPFIGATINKHCSLSKKLVGYWLFNEKYGDIARDYSVYKNYGLLDNNISRVQKGIKITDADVDEPCLLKNTIYLYNDPGWTINFYFKTHISIGNDSLCGDYTVGNRTWMYFQNSTSFYLTLLRY